ERLVLWRVADAILTDELQTASRIGLVDADDAGRHRHAEVAALFVFELVLPLDEVLERRTRMLRVAVVKRLTIDDVALLDRHAGRAEHAHLFRLAVVDRRLSSERVEVIVGERLLRHGCRRALLVFGRCASILRPRTWRRGLGPPATSCSLAFLNDVPLPFVSVTQPSR